MEPYRKTDFKWMLEIRILFCTDIALDDDDDWSKLTVLFLLYRKSIRIKDALSLYYNWDLLFLVVITSIFFLLINSPVIFPSSVSLINCQERFEICKIDVTPVLRLGKVKAKPIVIELRPEHWPATSQPVYRRLLPTGCDVALLRSTIKIGLG